MERSKRQRRRRRRTEKNKNQRKNENYGTNNNNNTLALVCTILCDRRAASTWKTSETTHKITQKNYIFLILFTIFGNFLLCLFYEFHYNMLSGCNEHFYGLWKTAHTLENMVCVPSLDNVPLQHNVLLILKHLGLSWVYFHNTIKLCLSNVVFGKMTPKQSRVEKSVSLCCFDCE